MPETVIVSTLKELLAIPSPSGFTREVAMHVKSRVEALGFSVAVTRRGALVITVEGRNKTGLRAMSAHLDTLGALVQLPKTNGRCELKPIGNWSARFAEGGRVTLKTDSGNYRGTVLPLKASGHAYSSAIDTQPVGWDNVELRLDKWAQSREDLEKLGVQPGDVVCFDTGLEIMDNGFIFSRYLDDKACCAVLLDCLQTLAEKKIQPLHNTCFIFTVREEIGDGAASVLPPHVDEFVAVDIGICAENQNSKETGVTIAMADRTGPFNQDLTRTLIELCREKGIQHQRDVFRHYSSDLAPSVAAGNDVRTALITVGVDSSHGYERTHLSSLTALSDLIQAYIQSPLTK